MSTSCTASRGFKARLGEAEADLFAERSENLGYDLEEVGLVIWIGDRSSQPTRSLTFRTQLRYRELEEARVSSVSARSRGAGGRAGNRAYCQPDAHGSLGPPGRPPNPRRGSIHQASLELATAAFGGTVDFVKSGSRRAGSSPGCRRPWFCVLGPAGLAGPFAGTESLPIQDRFFAGGSTSVTWLP